MGLLLTGASDRHIAYHYAIMIPRHHNSNMRISPTCFSSSCDFCISLINRISLRQLMNCSFWIYVDHRDCRARSAFNCINLEFSYRIQILYTFDTIKALQRYLIDSDFQEPRNNFLIKICFRRKWLFYINI